MLDPKYIFKIAVLAGEDVGKETLLSRHVTDGFNQHRLTKILLSFLGVCK